MGTKKSLGQHFLRDRQVAHKIMDAGDLHADDLVLEIGPGEGALTEWLVKLAGKTIAVEKDSELAENLRQKFSSYVKSDRLEILERDILDFDPEILRFYKEFSYKVIANIPYYITGAILRKFLAAKHQPELMVLMLQKEVAERIVAKKQHPLDSARGKESILSISVKAYGDPKIVQRVGRGAFRPAPKVDSAVLEIKNISRARFAGAGANEEKFFKILRAGFAHPRKKLASNLRVLAPKVAFDRAKIGESARAEELKLKDWLYLTKML